MTRARGANAQLLWGWEATYGTPPTSGTIHKLPFSVADIGDQQPLEADDTVGRGRTPSAPSRGVVTAGGTVTIPTETRAMGVWMRGLFGAPVTSGSSGAYVHTYSGAGAVIPSATAELGFTDIGAYCPNVGCMVDMMEWEWDSTKGRTSTKVTLKAQGENDKAGTAMSASPTEFAFTRFSGFRGVVKHGATELGIVKAASLSYSNSLDEARVLSASGRIAGLDPAMGAATGKVTIRFDDSGFYETATAGNPIALTMGYELDAATYLRFVLPAVYLPKAKRPVNGPAGIEVTLDFQAAKPASGAFVTAILANDVSGY